MTCHYCNQKRKKSRMRDLNNALKEGISANTSVAYRAGVPVVSFEQPGTRVVAMQPAAPSAPQLPAPNPTPQL